MLELNHILKGSDLLSGSSGPVSTTVETQGPNPVFDLKAGGIFKVDAPNADRAQMAAMEVKWNSSSH